MKTIAYLAILAFLTSCISHRDFSKLPMENEYELPRDVLVKKYSDIEEYEKGWRGFAPNMPFERDLVSKLGLPDKREDLWGRHALSLGVAAAILSDPLLLVVIALRPTPMKEYVFKKGNYCIKALVSYDAFVGYEDYVVNWLWKEGTEECV